MEKSKKSKVMYLSFWDNVSLQQDPALMKKWKSLDQFNYQNEEIELQAELMYSRNTKKQDSKLITLYQQHLTLGEEIDEPPLKIMSLDFVKAI